MSNVEVVSRVLNLLGKKKVTDINDDPFGPVIDDFVESDYKIVLSDFHWSFATRYFVLNKNTVNKSPEFNYTYTLPSYFLNKIDAYSFSYDANSNPKIESALSLSEYVIEDNFYTDQDGLLLKFVSSNVDLAKRSPQFIDGLAYHVAGKVTPVLLAKNDLVQYYEQMSERAIGKAKTQDQLNKSDYKDWYE